MKIMDLLSADALAARIDTAIGVFSPDAALKRMQARLGVKQASRLYEGATKGRRGDGWKPIASDSGRDSIKDLATLRQRSRDFSRNNGYAIKAVNAIAANTIGTGIVLQLKAKRKNGKTAIADAWVRWAESTACDFDGLTTFAGLQELAVKTIVESGEVLIRKRILDSKYYKRTGQVPLQLQILEPEFLASTNDTWSLASGHQIISGVEFNGEGQKVAYHIYKRHPSSALAVETVRVPAEDIIHCYRLDRSGSLRGVPWAAPIMLNLHDLDVYEDAELMRRKISACFAAFVTTPDIDDTTAEEREESYIDRMQPGMVEILPAGKTVTFGNPPQVVGYAEYATSVLHKIAAGYQVPYSVLTGDFSQVNFSSGRMGWLEFQRLIEQWRWNMIIPRMLDPIYVWFSQLADVLGMAPEQVTASWTAPRREMIDPLKEIEAILMMVKGGLVALPEAIRELGYDPDTVLEQIADYNAKLDAASVVLDSDPRQDPKRLAAKNIANQGKTV